MGGALEPHDVEFFETPGAFREWLRRHHRKRDVLWVGFYKKATGRASLTWEESVDEALCFGWIDGLRKRIDDQAYTIRFTPRRATSNWSLRNLERYAALADEGRIAPGGRAAFDERTADRTGVYSFEQSETPRLSTEFLERLEAVPAARADWESRPPGYRKRAAHWVMSAKRESTRERRMQALIDDSAAGRKINPLRR